MIYFFPTTRRITLHTFTIDEKDIMYPLLPPNRYLDIDMQTEILLNTVESARWTYKTLKAMKFNRMKHRKYVNGAFYTEFFNDSYEIIDIKDGETIDINIITEKMRVPHCQYFGIQKKTNHIYIIVVTLVEEYHKKKPILSGLLHLIMLICT